MTDYPEHEKLTVIRPQSQAVGEFIEWLRQNGMTICTYETGANADRYGGEYVPIRESRDKLLARHFEIDLDVIETEKRAMLAELSKAT